MRFKVFSAGLLTATLIAAVSVVNMGCKSEVKLEAKAPEPPKPPADADGDGVLDDGTDKCVNEKEDGLAPDAKDGCKSTDPDGDGVTGDTDKCPTEPEVKNDFMDEDGCPDVLPKVMIKKDEVKINDKILFAFGKATIDKASDDLIKNIAQVLNDNPKVEFVEVAGHADNVGNANTNLNLTKQRAQAVVDALVKLNVNKSRVRAAGYGSYCPVDAADTEEAREKNRRVEFKIMKMDGKETGVALGCDAAAAKGVKPAAVPAAAGAPTADGKKAESAPAKK